MNLTLDQKQKLEDLLQVLEHPKLKKLLKRAIPVWDKEGYETGAFGVFIKNHKVIRSPIFKGCCLIGAAILDVKISSNSCELDRPSWSVSGTSDLEFQLIIDVFDNGLNFCYLKRWEGKDVILKKNQLLVEEVNLIRNILFPI